MLQAFEAFLKKNSLLVLIGMIMMVFALAFKIMAVANTPKQEVEQVASVSTNYQQPYREPEEEPDQVQVKIVDIDSRKLEKKDGGEEDPDKKSVIQAVIIGIKEANPFRSNEQGGESLIAKEEGSNRATMAENSVEENINDSEVESDEMLEDEVGQDQSDDAQADDDSPSLLAGLADSDINDEEVASFDALITPSPSPSPVDLGSSTGAVRYEPDGEELAFFEAMQSLKLQLPVNQSNFHIVRFNYLYDKFDVEYFSDLGEQSLLSWLAQQGFGALSLSKFREI